MFEAEYARRAHHRGGGGRPHLLRGHRLSGGRPAAPSGLCRRPPTGRAAELHGVRVLNYLPLESLALLTDPAAGTPFK